ncbi:hypothetical protein CAPTEDRAFT_191713, partial [Capitella teleta]
IPYKCTFETDVTEGPANSLFWKVDITDFVNNNYRTKVVIPNSESTQFDAEYIPSDFQESIEIPAPECSPRPSCTSSVHWHSPKRQRSTLHLRLVQSPLEFKDRMTCYIGSTKRRFKSTTLYKPRMRPTDFSETCYVLPLRKDVNFITEMNTKSPLQQGKFVSMITLTPKTYGHNTVWNFEASKWEMESCSSDDASCDVTIDGDEYVLMDEMDNP